MPVGVKRLLPQSGNAIFARGHSIINSREGRGPLVADCHLAIMMLIISTQYKHALTNYGFSQGDIGKAMIVSVGKAMLSSEAKNPFFPLMLARCV